MQAEQSQEIRRIQGVGGGSRATGRRTGGQAKLVNTSTTDILFASHPLEFFPWCGKIVLRAGPDFGRTDRAHSNNINLLFQQLEC